MNSQEWAAMLEKIGIRDLEMAQRMANYWEKAEKAELMWCKDHDYEYFSFERCSACEREEREFREEQEANKNK